MLARLALHATAQLKGHLAADPDSEIATATKVTAGNRGDAVAYGDAADGKGDVLEEL